MMNRMNVLGLFILHSDKAYDTLTQEEKTFLPLNFIGFLFHIIDRYFLKKKNSTRMFLSCFGNYLQNNYRK